MRMKTTLIFIGLLFGMVLFSTSTVLQIIDDYSAFPNPQWYGCGGPWLTKERSDPSDSTWHDMMPKIKKWKFNTVRLAFLWHDDPNYITLPLDIEKLDTLLTYLHSNGLTAIMDYHILWVNSAHVLSRPEEWTANWTSLVSHFINDPRIEAWQLMNEPTPSRWPENIQSGDDLLKILADTTDAIRALGDTKTVVWPAPYYWKYDYQCFLNQRRDNLVIDKHYWSSKTGTNKEQVLSKLNGTGTYPEYFGTPHHLMDLGSPVWIGETGTHKNAIGDTNTTLMWEVEMEFLATVINLCLEHNCGFNLWRWEIDHFGREGLYEEILEMSNYTPEIGEQAEAPAPLIPPPVGQPPDVVSPIDSPGSQAMGAVLIILVTITVLYWKELKKWI